MAKPLYSILKANRYSTRLTLRYVAIFESLT